MHKQSLRKHPRNLKIFYNLKKLLFILCMLFTFFTLSMYAAPNTEEQEAKTKTEKYIRFVYDKLSFKKMQKLSFEAFSKGFYGYLNLKEAGEYLSTVDLDLFKNFAAIYLYVEYTLGKDYINFYHLFILLRVA